MKLGIQLFIMLAICITCTSLSCRKEKDELPRATQEGKNTFGCRIDGKIFIPKQAITYPMMPPLRSYYDESNCYFELRISEDSDERNNGLKRYMILKCYDLSIGDNPLNEENKVLIIISMNSQTDQHYETKATTGGTVTITRLDTIANIISGTFSFQAAPRFSSGPNISVTDGRFDITYQP